MSNRTFFNCATVASLTAVLLISFATAAPSNYTPGVKVGDQAKYNIHLVVMGNRTLVGLVSSGFAMFNNSDTVNVNITRVSGPIVNFTATFHYLNGTTYGPPNQGSDVSQRENSQGNSPPTIIAKGLAETDPVQESPNSPTLNDTRTLTVLGSSRAVNFFNSTSTQRYPDYYGTSLNVTQVQGYAWDQATGIPLSIAQSIRLTRGLSSGSTTTGSASYTIMISDTNLWSAPQPSPNQPAETILGLQPSLFYALVGATAVVVAGVAGFTVMRSRKPKAKPPTTIPPQAQGPAAA